MKYNKILIYILISILGLVFVFRVNFKSLAADTPQQQIDHDTQQIQLLNQKIAEYEAKLKEIGSDKKTLQDAIKTLDIQKSKIQAQISVAQKQINSTELQIEQLDDQISDIEQKISKDEEVLAGYLKNIQRTDDQSLLVQMLSSDDLSDIWQDFDLSLQTQNAIQQRTQDLQAQQENLTQTQVAAQQKHDELADHKLELTSQQQSLTATENSKNQLLKQTKAQESNYQKLLAQAKTELESYSAFTQNAGGANLLTNQTVCDGWGCYYNQRDSSWGALALNGTKYTLASDGCLVTSMAMVMTHYGYPNVTPRTINSNPSNFASYYPAFLLNTINVYGVTATRIAATIDAVLANGDPLVVGLNAYGGTHFVVLVSGSNGNYLMRDPYIANGKDINFSDHYKIRNIYKISKVVIN